MNMIDENWEPDTKKFKVVCQACGKLGQIDFDVPSKEAGFMLNFIDVDEGNYEYNLCMECEDEVRPPEPHKGS